MSAFSTIRIPLALLALSLCASALCFGAEAAATTQNAETGAANGAEDASAIGPDLSHPRAAVRTFLDAMNAVQAGDMEQMSTAMDVLYFDSATQRENVGP